MDLLEKSLRLPKSVGGTVDIMIGKQYLKYFPKEIIRLESGLTMYKSQFKSPDGTDGIISGPHSEFSKVDRMAQFASRSNLHFFTRTVKDYSENCKLSEEVPLLGFKTPHSLHNACFAFERGMGVDEAFVSRGPKNLKCFEK